MVGAASPRPIAARRAHSPRTMPDHPMDTFRSFLVSVDEEDWATTLRLGRSLLPESWNYLPDAQIALAINMALACHSLYKSFAGGPRDVFSAAVPRSERDLMYLLSALYWLEAEHVMKQNAGSFRREAQIQENFRANSQLFAFKLGVFIGASDAKRSMINKALAALAPAERVYLKEHIAQVEKLVEDHSAAATSGSGSSTAGAGGCLVFIIGATSAVIGGAAMWM
jgi:hypothetical protein